MSFTVASGKEGASPKKSLFLVTIVAPDGDTCYLTTAAYYGAPNIVYSGTTYLARIQKNELQPIQAMSPQGYDTVPGFTMTLADADKYLWTNHCVPHGWRGAAITITVILWDVPTNTYSTDALQWSFIGGNPQHSHAQGQTTLDVTSSTNFTRLKVPSIPIEYRCPWVFPSTPAQRAAALTDPSSIYYQCGYSADQTNGVGNYASPGVCFTACDLTRSSPTDLSVGCMARMGYASPPGGHIYGTSIPCAADGDITHDKAGHYTARFGGVTWLAPTSFSGRQYVSGQKTYGFNQTNTTIPGMYYNFVYGTQWVQGQVLAPAGDPNSVRSEVAVCVSLYGAANVIQVVVNGVQVPANGYDPSGENPFDNLFLWRYLAPDYYLSGPNGRDGALNGDSIFNYEGDPHGSMCMIEIVVPAELASPGSVPSCQVLVTSGPILNCYAIESVTAGVVTFTGPNYSCSGSALTVIIIGNSNPALNGTWSLTSWAGTLPKGTITLTGTTASGTGGGVFFYQHPDLWDTGGSILSNPTGNYVNIAAQAANLVFAVLDLMMWGNISLSQIDPVSWYNAAQIAATPITYTSYDGSTQTHAQFKAAFALSGNSRQTLAQALTALRNAGNLMVAPNGITGLIQCFVKQTLADQQPSAITGSNDSTARSSIHADNTSGTGYYAYLFNETNIEKDSFKISTTRIEATPNTVVMNFQDENNGYVQDSLTEIDPGSYAYSGNQEVQVPVPMLGIPNFDQGTRQANVQLAEALFGNPRNDAGGTTYFEWSTNQRVIHLAGRLGYICGLVWQELIQIPEGLGSTPIPIRILSMTPDTDGERWQIKAARHNDEWYAYAYGQNPAPYQNNPLLAPPARPPYPWRPGIQIWSAIDALWPNLDGFAFSVDTGQTPAQISISGNLPVNIQQSSKPPLVPLQAATASTGGSIPPGCYTIMFSTNGVKGPVSNPIVCTVPVGTTTNTITVAGIQWTSGAAPAIQPFIGHSSLTMRACGITSYVGSSPDINGNPTVYVFNQVTPDGLGLPDILANSLLVQEYNIAHGGVWGDSVYSMDHTGKILSFPEVTWTSSQWVGYILSLYYRPGAATQPALNMLVTASTANTLQVLATGFQPGDIVVMRPKAGYITSNTIGDDNFINWYSSGGNTSDETGNMIYIIAGTGAGYPPKTVISNTPTVYTIAGTWEVTPDASSIFIVLAPGLVYNQQAQAFQNYAHQPTAVATFPAMTTEEQSILMIVGVADANGNTSPMRYQPFREVYIPPSNLMNPTINPSTY